ncbi:MAG: GNAT family N-acetyltransferase [Lachnospiraceae bacterium]|nr:GNAT family N-acetyltransferase [Lachnospiraceae bacterium]MBQ9862944.1 GNAT family N-acetyltransferase [Lachnospiraceae bacterium]
MKIEDMHFKLKDSRDAIIRSPRAEDVQGTLDYLVKSSGETEFLLRYPEECAKFTPEGEKELFENWEKSDCETMLLCEVDGVVVGTSMVTWSNNIKTGHRARIAIGLLKDYWNLGIGTKFFEEMIKIAKGNPRITQMELEFMEGNSRARALYEKMGFRITGVALNAIRLKSGKFLNEYLMIKEL